MVILGLLRSSKVFHGLPRSSKVGLCEGLVEFVTCTDVRLNVSHFATFLLVNHFVSRAIIHTPNASNI